MKKMILIGLAILSVILLIVLIIIRKRKAVEASKPVATPSPNNPISVNTNEIDKDKQLSRGSRGQEVQQLQTWINQQIEAAYDPSDIFQFGMIFNTLYGLTAIAVDGIFGEQTEQALKDITGRNSISLNELEALSND
ncbi:MAG: peptidoglycan-binding protein [Saprospiraceae bacterium]|nr:peptidoglycan-binding protein [Saprospiraceae bacterium]